MRKSYDFNPKSVFMKRYSLVLILVFFSVFTSVAQVRLGLRASADLIFNRIKNSSDSVTFDNNGVNLRPSFGLIADFPISQNYYFNTGIGYISKRMKFKKTSNSGTATSEYIAQYIELPLSLKLYTNEVDLDKRVYFQIGTNMDVKVYDENKKGEELVRKFRPFDMTLLLGAGVEIYLGTNTSVLLGLSYQRGLINIIGNSSGRNDFSLKNDLFGVDVSLKL